MKGKEWWNNKSKTHDPKQTKDQFVAVDHGSYTNVSSADVWTTSVYIDNAYMTLAQNYWNVAGWEGSVSDPYRTCPKSDVQLPVGIIPGDRKAVGFVSGYRAWQLDLKLARLTSDTYSDHVWEPKHPQRAVDRHSGAGNGAGFYAAKELASIERDYSNRHLNNPFIAFGPPTIYVIGKVALWGTIKEHIAPNGPIQRCSCR